MGHAESFSRALLESAPDAVVVLDGAGTIDLVNARAEALLGRERAALVGRPLEPLVRLGEVGALALHEERRARRAAEGAVSRPVELDVLRPDGVAVPVEATLATLPVGGERYTILVLRDLTERRALEQSLRYRSSHDALTGLENRGAFDEALHRFAECGPLPVGVLMVDVDGLKTVNDRFGHAAGDELLLRAARVLRETFRAEDVVARIGGDEFAVLAPGQDARALAHMTSRLDQALGRFNAVTPALPLRVSVGFSIAAEGSSLDAAVREADAQMYLTKRSHHD